MSRISQPWIWIAVAVIVAGLLRLPQLDQRPMHTDEAVHAAKLGRLLDQGSYRYDPQEFHGPTLNLFTWPLAVLRGQRHYADLDETTLRLVPALFGLGLVLLPLALRRSLGWQATGWAVALAAVSPCMAFYSRYYIQETLLVFFTFGLIVSMWRYLQGRQAVWAMSAGACAGLMYATKETAIIAWGCLALAGLITRGMQRAGRQGPAVRSRDLGLAVAAGIAVWVLIYSSFLTNLGGVVDSVRTLAVYLHRAASGSHLHPWNYYLDLLTWLRFWQRPQWNEDFIVLMSCAGVVMIAARWPIRTCDPVLARLLTVYTLITVVAYSVIPYKTPWCMLGFVQGMTLVSAIAVAELTDRIRRSRRLWLVGVACVLVLGVLVPMAESSLLNYRYPSAAANPYVYSHTSKDTLWAVDRVRQIATASETGKATPIQVIGPGSDYWPLPWYLRDFTAVGYYQAVDFNTPPADVILAQATLEPDLIRWFYEVQPPGSRNLYVSFLDKGTRLRPGVELRGYIRSDLWDAVQDRVR
jgi:uncharacterized protein (TIGR03663 family)